jgi:hypothetical protein
MSLRASMPSSSSKVLRLFLPSFPMKQMTFAIAERVGKPTQTRKELFLVEGGAMCGWV